MFGEQSRAPQEAPDGGDLPLAKISGLGPGDFLDPRSDRQGRGPIAVLLLHRPVTGPVSTDEGSTAVPARPGSPHCAVCTRANTSALNTDLGSSAPPRNGPCPLGRKRRPIGPKRRPAAVRQPPFRDRNCTQIPTLAAMSANGFRLCRAKSRMAATLGSAKGKRGTDLGREPEGCRGTLPVPSIVPVRLPSQGPCPTSEPLASASPLPTRQLSRSLTSLRCLFPRARPRH